MKSVFRKLGPITAISLIAVIGLSYWGFGRYRAHTLRPRSIYKIIAGDRPFEIVPEPEPSFHAMQMASPRPEDVQKVKILNEILASRNDNDPRLDQDFNSLTPASKQLFRDQYRALAAERRNERGTVVFLLGRNLNSADDFAFLKEVIAEPPCLSMDDCAREAKAGPDSDHLGMGTQVSLAYPQLVALVSIENQISHAASASGPIENMDLMKQVLDAAAQSPVPNVSSKARAILDRLNHLKS